MAIKLDELQPELLQMIFEYVSDTSGGTISAICLVNKYFNAAIKTVIHRHKILVIPRKVDNRPLLDARHTSWLYDEGILRNTNHLIVKKNQGPDDYDDIKAYEMWLEPFCDLLARVGKLKTIVWLAGPIPTNVLEAIARHHPSAKLKVFNHRRLDAFNPQLDVWEDALAESPNLTHLRALGQHAGEGKADYCIAAAKVIFERVPNLFYAGVIADCDNPQPCLGVYHAADTEEGGAEAALPSRLGRISNTIRSLTLDGTFKFNKATLDSFAQYIDVSLLEKLKFSRGFPEIEYFQCAANMLPNLKEVSLNFGSVSTPSGTQRNPVITAASDYLLSCTPLRSLSLWSWRKVVSLEALVKHHGQSLCTLQLHEKEISSGPYSQMPSARQPFTPEDIKLLHRSCPHLVHLTIDLNREDEYLNIEREQNIQSSLKALAAFDNYLFTLHIYLDSSCLWYLFNPQDNTSSNNDSDIDHSGSEDGERRLPGLSASSDEFNSILRMAQRANRQHARRRLYATNLMNNYVTQIWRQIFGNRRYGERRLEVKFGEWEAKDLFTAYNPSAVDLRHYFQVVPHERDDMAGECQVSVFTKNTRAGHGGTFNNS